MWLLCLSLALSLSFPMILWQKAFTLPLCVCVSVCAFLLTYEMCVFIYRCCFILDFPSTLSLSLSLSHSLSHRWENMLSISGCFLSSAVSFALRTIERERFCKWRQLIDFPPLTGKSLYSTQLGFRLLPTRKLSLALLVFCIALDSSP
jgi:hypothetical protein